MPSDANEPNKPQASRAKAVCKRHKFKTSGGIRVCTKCGLKTPIVKPST